jgi:hypothetical protein
MRKHSTSLSKKRIHKLELPFHLIIHNDEEAPQTTIPKQTSAGR